MFFWADETKGNSMNLLRPSLWVSMREEETEQEGGLSLKEEEEEEEDKMESGEERKW